MAGLTREELIERVRKIIELQGTDEELEALAAEINASISHPDITDLIYDDEETMSPEEIVEKALSYKPRVIHLPASMPKEEKD